MRNRNRFVLAGGMLAGAVALGCQAPAPVQPTTRTPRVIHQVGAMQLTSDTDLALHFEQPCADGPAGYALQALDARIDFIKVTIVGPSHPDGLEEIVRRGDFGTECELTRLFENLSPGAYTFSMKGYKDSATPGGSPIQTMTSAPQTINIDTTTTETVTLKCDFTTGQVNVKIDCCSPAPSPTATPVPTPTPIPSTVQFEDLTNEGAYGFTVDTQGRPYVFGWDFPVATSGGDARIYRFTPGVAVVSPVPYIDNVHYIQEGSIADGIFTGGTTAVPGVSLGGTRMRLDLTAANPTPTYTNVAPDYNLIGHHGANALNPLSDKIYFGYGVYQTFSGYEDTVVYEAAPFAELYKTGSIPPQAVSTLPHTMEWAPTLGKPVWASQGGVFMPGATSATAPTRLVQGPAYGLLSLDDAASTGFLTRWGWSNEKSIFYYDLATSDVAAAKLTFTNGFPRTIEKGADENYYVFLSETGGEAPTPGVFHNRIDLGGVGGAGRFRIVKLKWDAATKVLTPDYIVVDNFVNKSPSW